MSRSVSTLSIPHVRGKSFDDRDITPAKRFIPACAGNTMRSFRKFRKCTVHPRVCGEHAYADCLEELRDGSSPCVRGTPTAGCEHMRHFRFIPACAGNTPPRRSAAPGAAVHPRVCGEHGGKRGAWGDWYGSSPRVRGTLRQEARHSGAARFIPACAGNTTPRSETLRCCSVHPRVCGEHERLLSFLIVCAGSSPRVRGTHQS